MASELRSRGATRIWLFGSLARGDGHEASDVDLLVEGLPAGAIDAAAAACADRLGADVDLVPFERAPSGLVEAAVRPGPRAVTDVIRRLLVEVRSDRQALTRQVRTLEDLDLSDASTAADLALGAWALHHGSSALEQILERVARGGGGRADAAFVAPRAPRGRLAGDPGRAAAAALARTTRGPSRVRVALRVAPGLAQDLDRLEAWLAALAA